MNITNKHGLPEPIVRAVENDPYDKGKADYTPSQLVQPPQIVRLMEQHADDIEEDASDRIWSLLGQAVHSVIERSIGDDDLQETRLYMDVNGATIGGQVDNYDLRTGILTDYKVTSAWTLLNGHRPEWEQQLNIYAELIRANGANVNTIQVVAILRDWSTNQAARNADYPQQQVATVDIPIWNTFRVLKFIEGRLNDLRAWPTRQCTAEERWAKPDVWAVHKKGRKSAVKLHDNPDDANKHADELGTGHYVEFRQGESTRCERYCPVAKFCQQFKQSKEVA